MEKRVISSNDIDDNIIRVVKAKHDAIEAIRQEKDAYINRVISDMKSEMTYSIEEINSAIEEGEKIIVEEHTDPTKISFKLKIIPFKLAEPARDKAFKRILDDFGLGRKIDNAYESILKTYRKAIRDAWNQKHPMLPGKLVSGGSDYEKTHLWVRNKPEEEKEEKEKKEKKK
jgi:hypothetical protein